MKLIHRNFPHRKIHIIQKHDYTAYRPVAHVDQIMKYKWAIDHLDLTDDFYAFNDDFFVMKPVNGTGYYHKGLLSEHIASRFQSDWYTKSLKTTQAYVGRNALSYELHLPFLFNKEKLYMLIKLLRPDTSQESPLIRSTYGNVFNVGGERLADVKNIKDFTNKTYLSTTEGSFLRQPIGAYIRSKL